MAFFENTEIYLVVFEILSFLGFLASFMMTLLLSNKYPKISKTKSWLTIQIGLICGVLHSLFDFLDTGDLGTVSEWFDLLDGLFFVVAICLVAVGLLLTAKEGKEQWGL